MKKGFMLLELVFVIIISSIVIILCFKPAILMYQSFNRAYVLNSSTFDLNQVFMSIKKELDLCFSIDITPTSLSCKQRQEGIFLDTNLAANIGYSGIMLKRDLNFYSPKSTFYTTDVNNYSQGMSSQLADQEKYFKRQSTDIWLYSLRDKSIHKALASLKNPSEVLFEDPSFTGFYYAYNGTIKYFLQDDKLYLLLTLPDGFVKKGLLLDNVLSLDFSKQGGLLLAKICVKTLGLKLGNDKLDKGYCLQRTMRIQDDL